MTSDYATKRKKNKSFSLCSIQEIVWKFSIILSHYGIYIKFTLKCFSFSCANGKKNHFRQKKLKRRREMILLTKFLEKESSFHCACLKCSQLLILKMFVQHRPFKVCWKGPENFSPLSYLNWRALTWTTKGSIIIWWSISCPFSGPSGSYVSLR